MRSTGFGTFPPEESAVSSRRSEFAASAVSAYCRARDSAVEIAVTEWRSGYGCGADLRRRSGVHRSAGCCDSLQQRRKVLSLVEPVEGVVVLNNHVVEFGSGIGVVERATVGGCTVGRLHELAAPGGRCRHRCLRCGDADAESRWCG